jgi:exodeoxyribonuclease-3
MKLVSWNVNGLRSALSKTLHRFMGEVDPAILCLQETKLPDDQVPSLGPLPYPFVQFHGAKRRGYSGTAVLAKFFPKDVHRETAVKKIIDPVEGRVMVLDFEEFFLVNVYTPNAGRDLRRLSLRSSQWDPAFRDLLQHLAATKPVLACGDFNVAHREMDLARPADNVGNAGFTDGERAGFSAILDTGFVDVFRHLHPQRRDAYSWWSFRSRCRARNIGWRIDYFLASRDFLPRIVHCDILAHWIGSDHAPLVLEYV